MRRIKDSLLFTLVAISLIACQQSAQLTDQQAESSSPSAQSPRTVPVSSPLVKQLVEAAIEQTTYTHSYDPAYVVLSYPGGDVPRERGVCTDVLVRAFRKNGIDLQKEIHEDMTRNFSAYPQKWKRSAPDKNIDHRRVPNLMTYFERRGSALPITDDPQDYLPGDIVAWRLSGGATHIGLMTNILTETSSGFQVVHHMNGGVKVEDVLFAWDIIGHYRYFN